MRRRHRYGTEPGGDVSNYLLCSDGTDGVPPASLTADLSEVEVARLMQAWRFVGAGPPRFMAMLKGDAYREWRH